MRLCYRWIFKSNTNSYVIDDDLLHICLGYLSCDSKSKIVLFLRFREKLHFSEMYRKAVFAIHFLKNHKNKMKYYCIKQHDITGCGMCKWK